MFYVQTSFLSVNSTIPQTNYYYSTIILKYLVHVQNPIEISFIFMITDKSVKKLLLFTQFSSHRRITDISIVFSIIDDRF